MQKILKLSTAREPGQSLSAHKSNDRIFQDGLKVSVRKSTTEEKFAAMLKRQAREAMMCVGECESNQIGAYQARLRDIEETIRFSIDKNLVPDNECGRSDRQLLYASTLGDLLECIKLTRQNHRAPLCVSDSALTRHFATIERKLDIIAGAIVRDSDLQEKLFGNQEVEA